jgi:large subunit ribosomal protein L30
MSAKEKRKTKTATTKSSEKTRKHATKAKKPEKKPVKPTTAPVVERPVSPKAAEAKRKPQPQETPFFLVVRLDGSFGLPYEIEYALHNLRLKRRFNAVLIEKNPSVAGMLRHVKDYVTWGEVNSEDVAHLLKERGELSSGPRLTDKFVKDNLAQESIDTLANALANGSVQLKTIWSKGVSPVFRLHPPSGGFKGAIKRPFNSRGELGYRHIAISNLMTRMS